MKLPKQVNIPYVGAMWTLFGLSLTIYSGINFIMQSRVAYYNQGDSLWRDIFGSYTLYIGSQVISLLGVMAFMHFCVFPSINKYQQEQAVKNGISPMFEEIKSISERLKRIEEKL